MTDQGLLPDARHFEQSKHRLFEAIAVDDRRTTRRHRLIALGVAAALVSGTTAGAYAIAQASQGQINYLTDCYAAADKHARHGTSVYAPGDRNDPAPTPLRQRIQLAEDMCAATWRIGTFSPGGSTNDREFPVPNLEACELPDGRLAVFPSDLAVSELCSRLGLTIPHE